MNRRLFVPEVVQTSTMDCGPACLSALLSGFGLRAEYGRLREACQTGIDGTNIDTLEQLANRMGLEAEQIVLPSDHMAVAEAGALPAIAVVNLPNRITHFVVVWRRHGRRLQVMDPVTGRRFTAIDAFVKDLFVHQMVVPAAAWREWAQSPEFAGALKARMLRLKLSANEAAGIIENALAQPGWRPIATLDATVRMLQSLANSGALSNRAQTTRLLKAIVRKALDVSDGSNDIIPDQYWSARRDNVPDPGEEQLIVRGAVLVRAKGRTTEEVNVNALPPEIAAAVSEHPPRPLAALWNFLKPDGVLAPAMLCSALFISALGIVLQALFFRGLIEGARDLSRGSERLTIVVATLLLLLLLTVIEIPAISALTNMGRRLEMRFRIAFLKKLPRIGDSYFHSRLTSDMAERIHSVYNLRALPAVAAQLLHSFFQLVLTTAAIIWVDPGLWAVAILSALVATGLPIAFQPLLGERELRVRTHSGALSRFYLDALLGLVPIGTHAAAAALRGEHRNLLKRWAAAGLDTQKLAVALDGLQMFTGFGLAALLTLLHAARHGEASALLLVAYWSLNIPALGRELAALACQYPLHRSVALRLLEPLTAFENTRAQSGAIRETAPASPRHGVSISMESVSMVAGGHTVLHDLTLDIPAGSHVAVVGQSGAGKSSFAGLLLGWNVPESGTLLIDGNPLTGASLAKLRREAAWIDPTVQLWNRSLVDNLRFGLPGDPSMGLGDAIERAELLPLVDKVPEGLQTMLGEGGSLVSGGEGQRIRIGRALLRSGIQLAVLDEPFRGLDAPTRKELLDRLRHAWPGTTFIFISHEIAETQSFDRVLVMHRGTVVEDGVPAELVKIPGSQYAALLEREIELKTALLHGTTWRRVQMHKGALSDERSTAAVRKMSGKERIA